MLLDRQAARSLLVRTPPPNPQAVHDRSQCLLRIAPYTPFKEGLRKTIEWALSDAQRGDHVSLPIELSEGAQTLPDAVVGPQLEGGRA